MAFKKGESGCPGGRTDPRKARAREAIARIVERDVGRIEGWVDEIERVDGPRAALQAYLSLLAFALPKPQRIEAEIAGKNEQISRIEVVGVASPWRKREMDSPHAAFPANENGNNCLPSGTRLQQTSPE